MPCGCPPPAFKETIPLESFLELSGSAALPTDIVEPDILMGVNVHVVVYPTFEGERFNFPEADSGGSLRYLGAGFVAFGFGSGYYLPEIPIQWDKSFFLIPPYCTHLRYWLESGVRIDIDTVIGTCPEDEEL